MKNLKSITLILFTFLSASCSFFSSDDSTYTRSSIINTAQALPGWKKLSESKNADLSYENLTSKSFIVLNSNCRKNQFSSLDALSNSIFAGIDNLKIHEKKKEELFKREALFIKAEGSIDGVVRFFELIIFQKNFCIYDSMLISSSESKLLKDSGDFRRFVQNTLKNETDE